MRLRKFDAQGDMTFGRGQADLWIDQPEGVGQSVLQRLMLNYGEWFADLSDGTPWAAQVLGERTQATRDAVVSSRVLNTVGVTAIAQYGSVIDENTRTWTATMSINTIYGPVTLVPPKLPAGLPALPPAPPATLLGILSGRTLLSMTPADLTQGPDATISEFVIRSADSGHY